MSVRFRDILRPESATVSLNATTKDGALGELARMLARVAPGATEGAIRAVLLDRERLASTGVGSGVAIPHGRLPSVDGLCAALAVHPKGLHFDAIDGQPVQILVCILGPDVDPSSHLKLLARASRILRNESSRAALLAARTDAELHARFLDFDDE